jgi:peptidoglycan lytic transglycosylase
LARRSEGVTALRIFAAAALAIACMIASSAAWAGQKRFSGVAAYYSKGYSGRVASGGRYDPTKLTAAHKTLPFGTHVRVTDRRTHRSVVVTITDRGPYTKGRVIDLSMAAARQLGMLNRGVVRVTAEVQPQAYSTAAE